MHKIAIARWCLRREASFYCRKRLSLSKRRPGLGVRWPHATTLASHGNIDDLRAGTMFGTTRGREGLLALGGTILASVIRALCHPPKYIAKIAQQADRPCRPLVVTLGERELPALSRRGRSDLPARKTCYVHTDLRALNPETGFGYVGATQNTGMSSKPGPSRREKGDCSSLDAEHDR